MKELIIQRHGIRCKKSQLYRARSILKDMMDGSHQECYARLPTYIQMILDRECRVICGITWRTPEVPSANPMFKKIFISFDALYNGFLSGCRPFIGVDGTHLRGRYEGTLLVAASLDGDNGILPIAYAVVDKETKENWSFFFII
uniref:MULE transposase domain-containing protein n=1 Tax=Chenopodium quinoa TaxID=63459 RepID=A0A803N8W1_CHEQI